MTWLKTVWAELVGLFVDDVGFAIGIVAWLAVVVFLNRLQIAPPAWRGALLFGGLAALFVESTLRRARK
jgi:hypothetical protein